MADTRDVLAMQGPQSLDMASIRGWCLQHGTAERLPAALQGNPRSHHIENGGAGEELRPLLVTG